MNASLHPVPESRGETPLLELDSPARSPSELREPVEQLVGEVLAALEPLPPAGTQNVQQSHGQPRSSVPWLDLSKALGDDPFERLEGRAVERPLLAGAAGKVLGADTRD